MAEVSCVSGKGIQVRGNLSGSGDLVVEGRVEGHIALQDHITVEEIGASERVSISSTATVIGGVRAPRIVIEDGARFRGNIEMDVPLPANI